MSYDPDFDRARLEQLAEQYLRDSTITGRVLFFSESEGNRFDYGSLQFSDSDYENLKESGFKAHLMELLDILLIYRAQHEQPNASQGVVYVNGDKISIEWLPKASVDALRNAP